MKKLVLLMLLSGCAASGPIYQDLDKGKFIPEVGMAKIIVLRDDHPIFKNGTFWVEIDGKQICDLHAEAFIVHEVQPGKHLIESSLFGEIGTSRLAVDTKPNQTIYVRMVYKTDRGFYTLLGGAFAQSIAEASDNSSGPVTLNQITKETAFPIISSFNYENKCQ